MHRASGGRESYSPKSPDSEPNHRNRRRKSPRTHRRSPSPSSDEEQRTPPPKRKKEEPDPILTRTGGAYIPPARLRMMQAAISDKSSVAYQRISWEALKKSINGLINKVNVHVIHVCMCVDCVIQCMKYKRVTL